MYPQPNAQPALRIAQPATQFYQYDRALPFSPTAGSFYQHQAEHGPTMAHDPTMLDSNEVLLDIQYPSPTSGLYSAGLGRPLGVPMSDRWDRAHGHHMLPSTSEIPLEGLFDTSGGMAIQDDLLNDFGAALAQSGDGAW